MKSILKYPGAKWRIAKWIIDFMPKHHSYVEPFFGSGAVFFNKPVANIETINDLDSNVCNLFKVVRKYPKDLANVIATTPFARQEYDETFGMKEPDDEIEKARQFLIQCWQGHGFRTNGYKVGWKNDVQGRESMYAVKNWYRLPEWIIGITDRLKRVQIENRPAVEVIKRFRYPNVLVYADPPYLLGTRTAKQYKHEMTDQDHVELLETLLQHPGPVILSGYPSDMYCDILKDWKMETTQGHAEYYGADRKEVIWMNFEQEQMQISL